MRAFWRYPFLPWLKKAKGRYTLVSHDKTTYYSLRTHTHTHTQRLFKEEGYIKARVAAHLYTYILREHTKQIKQIHICCYLNAHSHTEEEKVIAGSSLSLIEKDFKCYNKKITTTRY